MSIGGACARQTGTETASGRVWLRLGPVRARRLHREQHEPRGGEHREEHVRSGRVDHRWRNAPNDLKIAPCRMSVPIAIVGLNPNTSTSNGVISEPPPMPVMPTRSPINRRERELPVHASAR